MWRPDDVISTDRYLEAFPNDYYKTDIFYMFGGVVEWRNKRMYTPNGNAKLVVSGHSDFPIDDRVVGYCPQASWFGVNVQSKAAYGLPLGITNNTLETDFHPIYGNVNSMHKVAQEDRVIKNLAYMNFSIITYPYERQRVDELFSGKSWVTKGHHVPTQEGREQFLRDIRNHSFVLCPRGAGIDTHRLWETLYMGSIPIVKNDVAHENWLDLPILFIDSWDQVTEEFLLREKNRIEGMRWNRSKLHSSYWINYIHENRNNPRRNRLKPFVQ